MFFARRAEVNRDERRRAASAAAAARRAIEETWEVHPDGPSRPIRWTLRLRLTAWNALAVLIATAVTLLGLRVSVWATLQHETDQLLVEDLQEIRMALKEGADPHAPDFLEELDRRARGHVHNLWFAQLLDANGRVWNSTVHAPAASAAMNGGRDFAPVSSGEYRVCQFTTNQPRSGPLTIRVGTSTAFIDEDMVRLDRSMILVAASMTILAPVVGWWLAGRATRPLQKMIQATARLRPQELTERLPESPAGDELDQLAAKINGLLDRIGGYVGEKRDFLANAAHELRTPLAAIRSSVEVSLNEQRSVDEYQELLDELLEQCSSLETLVNQLLLLAETDAVRLNTIGQYVDLDEVVQKAVDMFQAAAEVRDVTIAVRSTPHMMVEGNRHHLHQVLNNLLDNAIKFTPPGGRIAVSLSAADDEGRLTLRVSDTGVGIPPDDLAHVFERFYRVDRARTRVGDGRGTGLGLSICKAIVEAHDGEIWVSSTPGRGTTFTIVMPTARPIAAPTADSSAAPTA
ncbi:MAG TPA: ATP-binding protein [Pirellulales bacterium]